MLSDLEKAYLKKYLARIVPIIVIIGLIPIIIYAFNLDFKIKEKYLAKNGTGFPEEIIQTPVKMADNLYNRELGLLIVAQMQATGKLMGSNKDFLRSTCPFRKKEVKSYNERFLAVALSIKGRQEIFAVTPNSRTVRQFLEKLSTNDDFLREKLDHKITLIGYALILRDFLDVQAKHMVVNKVILDGVVYE